MFIFYSLALFITDNKNVKSFDDLFCFSHSLLTSYSIFSRWFIKIKVIHLIVYLYLSKKKSKMDKGRGGEGDKETNCKQLKPIFVTKWDHIVHLWDLPLKGYSLGITPKTMFWVLISPTQRNLRTENGIMVDNLFRYNR